MKIRSRRVKTSLGTLAGLFICIGVAAPAGGVVGSFFLTGHDPDFHALSAASENPLGAQNINTAAISFVMDPSVNAFVAAGVDKFLFVESTISPPSGHRNGVDGMVASGYSAGTDFEHHDAASLGAELDLLGTKYSAIVVASDYGGVLTQAELDILNARSGDIVDFLNAGGGVYAMAESHGGTGLTTDGLYGFLPFVASSTSFNNAEVGNTVTPFGASIGLTSADVNGNFSHNVFPATFGLQIVDQDPAGNILSLAGRGTVHDGGVSNGTIPEPMTAALGALGLAAIGLALSRRGSA